MTFEEWAAGEKKESEERILELVKALLQDNRLEELSQISEDTAPVSYTHLDVYKRQIGGILIWRLPVGVWRMRCRTR